MSDRRVVMSFVTRSITCNCRASLSVAEMLFLTASSAHCAFLPLLSARDLIYAAASFVAFSAIVLSIFSPTPTGWAAPMLVPGAIAATWAARVRKTPAEAALLPLGETKTTTGDFAADDVLYNSPHRGIQSAGRIEFDNERLAFPLIRLEDAFPDEFSGDGIDDAINRYHHDRLFRFFRESIRTHKDNKKQKRQEYRQALHNGGLLGVKHAKSSIGFKKAKCK